jgi:hypothetical protein
LKRTRPSDLLLVVVDPIQPRNLEKLGKRLRAERWRNWRLADGFFFFSAGQPPENVTSQIRWRLMLEASKAGQYSASSVCSTFSLLTFPSGAQSDSGILGRHAVHAQGAGLAGRAVRY